MSLRSRIESTFGEHACDDALLFAMPHGFRVELTTGSADDSVDRARLALKNAMRICRDIFTGETTLVVSLKARVIDGARRLPLVVGDLRKAGVPVADAPESWVRIVGEGEDEETWEVAAFETPASSLHSLVWHAVTVDLGVRSGPSANVYLFNIPRGIAAHPYDDRGMDIVGPNHNALADLSGKYQDLLMESKLGEAQ